MFKGTETVPAGEFSKIVSRNGGQDNAFTSYDYTGYFQSIAADRLELVMRLEADRMQNLVLDPAEIETERAVVLEERRSRTDNSPAARLREQASAAFYMNHPYGRPIIGWEHEIKAITPEDLQAFYDRWYGPDNAILVVVGDVSMEEVLPLAEKYYGAIAKPEHRTPGGVGGAGAYRGPLDQHGRSRRPAALLVETLHRPQLSLRRHGTRLSAAGFDGDYQWRGNQQALCETGGRGQGRLVGRRVVQPEQPRSGQCRFLRFSRERRRA